MIFSSCRNVLLVYSRFVSNIPPPNFFWGGKQTFSRRGSVFRSGLGENAKGMLNYFLYSRKSGYAEIRMQNYEGIALEFEIKFLKKINKTQTETITY